MTRDTITAEIALQALKRYPMRTVLALTGQAAPEFVAKTALYARSKGRMKDMPALLVAALSVHSPGLMAEVFDRMSGDILLTERGIEMPSVITLKD